MKLIEIPAEGELILCPDALETCDKFSAASVSLCMIQPPLSDRGEFGLRGGQRKKTLLIAR